MEETTRKKLGLIDCLGIGIGQVIGSGIIVFTGLAIGSTGHGTPLAFLACALIAIINLVSAAVLSSSIPSNGGGYSYVKRLLGPRIAFLYIGMFVLSQVLIATFAIGFAQYFTAIVPTANEKVVAMTVLTLATLVNYFGVKSAASVQNIMVMVLLVTLGLFVVFGFPQVEWSAFAPSMANYMPNGFGGFFQAVTFLSFATSGAKFLAETAGEVKNPGRTVPLAMIISTVIVCVFYALIGVVASGVLPLDMVAFMPLTLVAQQIFPSWLYYFFIIGGALFALATTLNGTLSWVTRGLQQSAMDGWLPESLAKENKYGAPVFLLLVFYIMGVIPIVTGMDTSLIANMGIGLGTPMMILEVIACWRLPKLEPEAYEKAPIKFKPTVLYALLLLSLICYFAIFITSMSSLTPEVLLASAIYVGVLVAYMCLRWKHVQAMKAAAK